MSFLDAARSGDVDQLRLLAGAETDVQATDESGRTALHLAARSGRASAVAYLIQLGLDAQAKDNTGSTPLHLAAARGRVEAIRALAVGSALINVQDASGQTPLHVAVLHDQYDAAGALVSLGADTSVGNSNSETSLHLAVLTAPVDTIELLVSSKSANLNATDVKGWTPLHIACAAARVDIVDLLCRQEAQVEPPDTQKRTPMHLAVERASIDTVKVLIQHGANVNAIGADRQTPLHLAALGGYADMVQLLHHHGADMNARDEDGNTPAMFLPGTSFDRIVVRFSVVSQVADVVTDLIFIIIVAGEVGRATQPSALSVVSMYLLVWAVMIGLIPFIRSNNELARLWNGAQGEVISYKVYAVFEGGIELLVLYSIRHMDAFIVLDYVFIGATIALLAADCVFVIRSVFHVGSRLGAIVLVFLVAVVAAACAASRFNHWSGMPFLLIAIAYLLAVVWASILVVADDELVVVPFSGIRRSDKLFRHPAVRFFYLLLSVPLIFPVLGFVCILLRRRSKSSPSPLV